MLLLHMVVLALLYPLHAFAFSSTSRAKVFLESSCSFTEHRGRKGVTAISLKKGIADFFSIPDIDLPFLSPSGKSGEAQRRNELKAKLLAVCTAPDAVERFDVEKIISDLAPLSPVTNTADSPLLQKEWEM
jgi:hypothetical protein